MNTSNAASPKQRKRQGEKSIKIKCHMRKRLGDKDKIKIGMSGFRCFFLKESHKSLIKTAY